MINVQKKKYWTEKQWKLRKLKSTNLNWKECWNIEGTNERECWNGTRYNRIHDTRHKKMLKPVREIPLDLAGGWNQGKGIDFRELKEQRLFCYGKQKTRTVLGNRNIKKIFSYFLKSVFQGNKETYAEDMNETEMKWKWISEWLLKLNKRKMEKVTKP